MANVPKNVYLTFDRKTITVFSDSNINSLYSQGYLFTRIGKGVMDQTQSLRIDLSKFTLSSENKRILNRTEDITLSVEILPYQEYHWSIGKLAKDFYEFKSYKGTFSSNKIKEILTNEKKSNFNKLFIYSDNGPQGYTICCETDNFLHYSYPFYNLEYWEKNIGMGMMVKAITYAVEQRKAYVYLGSAHLFSHTYKLQFEGLEWFEHKTQKWSTDIEKLKQEYIYSYRGHERYK